MLTFCVIVSRQSILPAAGFRPAHSLPLCFATSLHPCPLSPRWSPVVFPWKTPSISFPFMPLHGFSRHNEGGTPTPINLSPSFNGRQCHFSLTPVFATHPKNAPVTPFLATHPKTQVFKVLCLPHIQKMAGVGVLLLTRRATSIPFTLSLEGSDHRESRDLSCPPQQASRRRNENRGSRRGRWARCIVPLHRQETMKKEAGLKAAPTSATATVIYAAFISFWRELLQG